jgi:regulator of protease activity HflC (stomatin/prohibitin superfamily)
MFGIRSSFRRVPVANITSRRNFFKIVQPDEQAQRTFLGMFPKTLENGIRLNIPLVHDLRIFKISQQQTPVSGVTCYSKDGAPLIGDVNVFFTIVDTHKARFKAVNVYTAVKIQAESGLRSVLGGLNYDDINSRRDQVQSLVFAQLNEVTKEYGVRCDSIEIQRLDPSNDEVKRVMEKQIEAERLRREQVLKSEAAVNVATAEKTAAILKSEGDLQAVKNSADAKYYQVAKETEAISNQIKEVQKAFGGDVLSATQYLLNNSGINAYKSVVGSSNNKLVFLAPGQSVGQVPMIMTPKDV